MAKFLDLTRDKLKFTINDFEKRYTLGLYADVRRSSLNEVLKLVTGLVYVMKYHRRT
jgi:hypothetical protein